MVIVGDMDCSVRFYHDVLGLSVEYESAAWTQLDAGAVSIGLHGAKDGPGPKPGSPACAGFGAISESGTR